MPEIKINGLSVNYLFFGEANHSVPNVLVIHGAGQSSVCWEKQFDFFNSYKRFNFFLIDLPGHGKSEGNGFISIKEYADFIEDFVQKLNLKDLILIGHSMGGRISQIFAINYPDVVIGCVLVGTGARIRVTKATLKAAENDFEYFGRMATKNSFSESTPQKTKEIFYERLINSSQITCVNDLIACNEFDVIDDITKINIPTLIIAGEKDILAPVKHSKNLNKDIKNSKMFVISGAGHFMMIEKPDEFNKLINNYLDFI